MITKEDIKKILDYDQKTGELIWITSLSNRATIGNIVGSNCNGYLLAAQITSKLRYNGG